MGTGNFLFLEVMDNWVIEHGSENRMNHTGNLWLMMYVQPESHGKTPIPREGN